MGAAPQDGSSNDSKDGSLLPRLIAGLAELAGRYDVILCDVWGVVHNGAAAFAPALDALARFRAKGGAVALITNSPAPAASFRRNSTALARRARPMTRSSRQATSPYRS